MKTLKFILLLICCGLTYNITMAQTVTKSVKGETFVIDKKSNLIYNQKNSLEKKVDINNDLWSAEPTTPLNTIYKKVFTPERIETLKNTNMGISFVSDATGKVEEIKLIFVEEPVLTVEEVKALEDNFKGYKFKLNKKWRSPETKSKKEFTHYQFTFRLNLHDL